MALNDAFPGVSGGPDSIETRKALAGLVIRDTAGNARPGIFPRHGNPLLSVRSDMRVDIAAFEGISVRGGGPNFMANDGVVQSPVLTSPASNSILHVIYFKQNESAAPFSDANNLPLIGVLSSAAAAIPVKPDLSTVAGAVELGTVLIPSGKTATNQSGVLIGTTHQFTTTTGSDLWFRTKAEMDAVLTLAPGVRALVLADFSSWIWNGTNWGVAEPYRMAAGIATTGVGIPSGTTQGTTINFPAGRFTAPPIVFVTPGNARHTASVDPPSVTTSSALVTVGNWSPSTSVANAPFFWVAIQMSAASGVG